MIEEQINKRSVKKKKKVNATDCFGRKNQSVNISVLMQRKETENTGYSEKC